MGVKELESRAGRESYLATAPIASGGEWKRRCAKLFQQRGGVTEAVAVDLAKACFEQRVNWDHESDPEGAADVKASYWNG
ncbi:hypothetical protein PAN31117_05095 [Pandoraea anapnoica]|uniref:Uncharacterized protein n=1 Tax=Pandoraea anapnoica TaxID=2508301 RepID=A0A5E5ARK4_9BURK|nr:MULTISPECIES: hypothetical protein [Pandoraea]VVE58474.1 hypothetical protein PIN31009_05305 [Pandoraea iniqua]VVE75153.1 hypothetical protein PAN31117_05095 [Pandoraea anapnoica]